MPKFQMTVVRRSYEYQEVTVEAPTYYDARIKAQETAEDEDFDWGPEEDEVEIDVLNHYELLKEESNNG